MALEDDKLWGHWPSQRRFPPEELAEQISLEELLQSRSGEWPHMAKLVLAVILAHSLLYLNDGPWLNGHWTRSNIVFYNNGAFIPARPFLRTQIAHSGRTSLDTDDFLHRYPGILDFGVTVLEIHLGKRIDENLTTSPRRWGRASQILEQRRCNMYDHYRNAVIACLQPDFGAGVDCTPQQLRQLIFDKIVSPLKKELAKGFQGIIKVNSLDEAATQIDLISG